MEENSMERGNEQGIVNKMQSEEEENNYQSDREKEDIELQQINKERMRIDESRIGKIKLESQKMWIARGSDHSRFPVTC